MGFNEFFESFYLLVKILEKIEKLVFILVLFGDLVQKFFEIKVHCVCLSREDMLLQRIINNLGVFGLPFLQAIKKVRKSINRNLKWMAIIYQKAILDILRTWVFFKISFHFCDSDLNIVIEFL